MSIEEIFAASLIEVLLTLRRIAEQRCRMSFEDRAPEVESLPAHVDANYICPRRQL
jgi:hypothetical protein